MTGIRRYGPSGGGGGEGGAVDSVNGQTGAVNLDANAVGAAAAVHDHVIDDVTGLQDALDAAGTGSGGGAAVLIDGVAVDELDIDSTPVTWAIADATDYDAAAPAPLDGWSLGWWDGANGGAGGWQPQPVVTNYQRTPIGGTPDLGTVTSPWTPDATVANDVAATTATALTVNPPAGGTDGQRYTAWIAATAAVTITLAAPIKRLTGVPASLNVPTGGLAMLTVRYSELRLAWTATVFAQEQ